MENGIIKDITCEIENLDIKDDLKEKLIFFAKKIDYLFLKDRSIKFDIIIDNMVKTDIDILLEYCADILLKYCPFKEIIKYRKETRLASDIKNSIIVIDDFVIFEEEILNYYSDSKIRKFFLNLRRYDNILIITNTSDLERQFQEVNDFIFDTKECIHLKGNEDRKQSYEKLLARYKDKQINCLMTYDFYEKLYNILSNNEYSQMFYIDDYIYEYSIKKMILDDISFVDNTTFSTYLTDDSVSNNENKISFENLVGLSNIKEQLNSLYNYLEFSKKAKFKSNIYFNLFFLGNPGTGKTTVARMYAEKLYNLGYIKENKVIEVVPNDLMGEYVGQTRRKTRAILEEAENGILFIDEAYLLYQNTYRSSNGNPYMEEAVVELIKYLEDPKNIVIFAGYTNKMRKIYEANAGLKSRIYGEIIFADYTSNELYEILSLDIKEKGLKLDTKSKKSIIKYINNIKNREDFGNARTIKQLAQRMIINHANRKLENENFLLSDKDLPIEKNFNSNRMGFGMYDGR